MCVRILETELRKRDAPTYADLADWVWPVIEAHGDPGLQAELKPQVARGTARLSLGYTEPDGGSDIAGAKTRAVRDGDEWVINGQKIFTSGAHRNQYIFLITRTDPTLPKHKGLTMFLVPLDSPGIEIHPLPLLGDERANITYYGDVRISDRYRLGEVNNGWSVLHGPLDTEHSLQDRASKFDDVGPGGTNVRHLAQSVEAAVRWAIDAPDGDGPMIGDEVFLAGIGRLLAEMEASACSPTAMGKVKGADVAILGCELLMDLVGPEATLPHGADSAIAGGAIEYAHRAVQQSATAGGTVEVFRTMIAQLHLGLPRPDYHGRKAFLTGDRPAAATA